MFRHTGESISVNRPRRPSRASLVIRCLKLLIMTLFGIAGALAIASSAGAFFTFHSEGAGSATVAALNPPTDVTATLPNPDVRTVDVTWNAVLEPAGITPDGYYVQSFNGAETNPACGTSPTVLITTLSCTDSDVSSATYTYLVTAVFRSWTAVSAPSQPVTVPAAQLTSLSLSPSTATPTAGSPFSVGITAYDQYGNVFTSYDGQECLSFSGPDVSPDGTVPSYPGSGSCSSGSEVMFQDGVASGPNAPELTLYNAESLALSASDNPTGVTGTADLTVGPGAANTFNVDNPGTETAGQPFDDTITAYDAYGNVATGYSGSETVVFTGPSPSPNATTPTYPASVLFTAGVGNATGITLVDAQTTALTATQDLITGASSDFVVNPGPAATFDVANPGTQLAGQPFGDTITAYDAYGNVATGYSGSETVVFTGPSPSPNATTPTYPASVLFTAGVGNATGITLVDAQTTALTATQDLITGTSNNFVVNPSPASSLVVSAPPTATVAAPFAVTITAYDAYGNEATGYDGTVALTSSLGGQSPASATLASGTDVVHDTLANTGEQTITATDSVSASITGTSGQIDVSSAPETTYTVTYDAGAATSGTAPVDPNSPYAVGSTVTVLGNTGNLAESGYSFVGWNSAADGSGTNYAPGAMFVINANTVLYPVFTAVAPVTYTVTYDAGAATSGTAPVDPNSPYPAGSTVTVLGNTGNLVKVGYSFAGWSTAANGSGTSYQPGSTFTISANTMLYPVFSKVAPVTYTVTYLKGSATSGTVPVDPNSPYAAGSTVTVLGNTGNLAEPGYSFVGWNSAANGSGASYQPGSTFTITASVVLYPVFVEPLTITTRSLASATAGEPNYAQTLEGSGGTTPYSWSISEGVLPKGLSLDSSTGLISGSLSSSAVSETFTVTLSDPTGASVTKEFTITVCGSLTITTTSLAPAFSQESNYTQQLEGSGGSRPYTWSISAGSLPSGLSLNPSTGLISGSLARAATTESFTVTLSDANGASTSRQFTITVNNKPSFVCSSSGHAFEGHWFYFWAQTFGSPGQQFREFGRLPPGLQFDPTTGIFYGTPGPGSAGVYAFTVTVTNAWGTSSLSFTLDISSSS